MPTHLDNEQSLVAAAQAGDSDAFITLLNQYSRHIYRVGLSITGNHQDAEDVLQESSLKAFGYSIASTHERHAYPTTASRLGGVRHVADERQQRSRYNSHAPRSLSHQCPRWSGKHSPAGEKSKPGSEPAQGIRELEHGARIFTSNHGRHQVRPAIAPDGGFAAKLGCCS